MKKTFLLLALTAFLSSAALAQRDDVRSSKNEFSFGYGVLPSSSMRWNPGSYYKPTGDFLGAIYATYTHRFTKVIGVGATYCYDPRRLEYYEPSNWNENPICRLNESSHTLMVHLKINWLNRKHVNLYSKIGQGIYAWNYRFEEYQPDLYEITTPSNELSDRYDYAYQIVPIGIEVGNQQYAGFVQVGLGMEGMISIGFRYGLNNKE